MEPFDNIATIDRRRKVKVMVEQNVGPHGNVGYGNHDHDYHGKFELSIDGEPGQYEVMAFRIPGKFAKEICEAILKDIETRGRNE